MLKAGKTKKEIEQEEKERAAEAAADKKDQGEEKKDEIRYKMGDDYDNQIKQLREVDYEFEQFLAKAKVKALNNKDLKVYKDLEEKKMTK